MLKPLDSGFRRNDNRDGNGADGFLNSGPIAEFPQISSIIPAMPIIAAVQMVSSDTVAENLAAAERLIARAARKKAALVSLPENFALMAKRDRDTLALREPPGAGPLQTFLSAQARQHRLWLLGGTIPLRSEQGGKAHAASLLYNPAGECRARYNKIHLFDVRVDEAAQETYRESDCFTPGREVVVAATDTGNIGLSVCYDLRFPELYRKMQRDNVQIIAAPSAFTARTGEAHWETLIKARAIENLCYLIASNQGGSHANGRETWGHSMIIDPWGKVLARLDKGEGVVTAEIDLAKQARLRALFPALSHIRLAP